MRKNDLLLMPLVIGLFVFFIMNSFVSAAEVSTQWAKKNLKNTDKASSIPVWQITKDGKSNSINWKNFSDNPRFAIYDNKTSEDPSDDIVLDKETGLVWSRNANGPSSEIAWLNAVEGVNELTLANKMGWRLPTIEEISSLRGATGIGTNHPFVDVQNGPYWTSSTHPVSTNEVWTVKLNGETEVYSKGRKSYLSDLANVLAVRGGSASYGVSK